MTNNDRLHKLYVEIRDLAVIMDPSQVDNFTANVRLMAGENLSPQAWVDGAKAALEYIERQIFESDTGWITTINRRCYLQQTRSVVFREGVTFGARSAFFCYERLIWDGQEFRAEGGLTSFRMFRAIDSGD